MNKKLHKKTKKNKSLKVNPQLDGFNIKLNSFGELESNYKIEDINQFLNENLTDKKLSNPGKKNKNSPSGKKNKDS